MPLRKEAQVLHRLKKKQKRSKLCKTNKNNNKNNHKYSTLEILVLLFHKLKKANHRQLFSPKSDFLQEQGPFKNHSQPLKLTRRSSSDHITQVYIISIVKQRLLLTFKCIKCNGVYVFLINCTQKTRQQLRHKSELILSSSETSPLFMHTLTVKLNMTQTCFSFF